MNLVVFKYKKSHFFNGLISNFIIFILKQVILNQAIHKQIQLFHNLVNIKHLKFIQISLLDPNFDSNHNN